MFLKLHQIKLMYYSTEALFKSVLRSSLLLIKTIKKKIKLLMILINQGIIKRALERQLRVFNSHHVWKIRMMKVWLVQRSWMLFKSNTED